MNEQNEPHWKPGFNTLYANSFDHWIVRTSIYGSIYPFNIYRKWCLFLNIVCSLVLINSNDYICLILHISINMCSMSIHASLYDDVGKESGVNNILIVE